jgi:hypothetical protein
MGFSDSIYVGFEVFMAVAMKMRRRVNLVRTDISEELAASIFR